MLETDAVLFVSLAMVLGQVLRERHTSLRTLLDVAQVALTLSPFELLLHVSSAWHHDICFDPANPVFREVFLVLA